MRSVCVQFQPGRLIPGESRVVQAFRAALPDAEFVAGEDDGCYVNVHFHAKSPEAALSRVRTVLDSPTVGRAARSSCIVVCQGDHGWDDYLLLHHYDPAENLDLPVPPGAAHGKEAAMAATWDHPKLGTFTYDSLDWVNTISMPAFKSFSYDTGYSNAPRSTGMHELAFEADDEKETPSPAAVALAEKVLANQKELVTKVTEALWKDFNGGAPHTNMWWHGDLDQVAEVMDADKPPGSPRQLLKLLRLSRVEVLKGVHRYDRPVVELRFHAPFEEEHGVGLLTDGQDILGIGYSSDVTPFEPA